MKGKRSFYVILAIVVIAAIVVILAVRIYNKPHRVVATATPAFTMTASELVEEFVADEGVANATYGGQVVQLKGTLKEVIRNDSTLILLLGDTAAMIGVSAYLQPDEDVKYAGILPGETITVKGICDGMLIDVVLGNAIVLTDE